MENVNLYNELSKKIKKTSSLIKIFGILSLVFFVFFIISTFFRTEKVPVLFDAAEKGEYTSINVIMLEEYRTTDNYTYFYYTANDANDGVDGCLRLPKKDAQAEGVRALIDGEISDLPVTFYGYIRTEKSYGSAGGNSFSLTTEIFYATLKPEMKKTTVESIFMILGSLSIAITFISSMERRSAKRKIKLLSANSQ